MNAKNLLLRTILFAVQENKNLSILRKTVFNKVRNLFGGNLTLVASGGAPLCPKLAKFVKNVLGAYFVQVII